MAASKTARVLLIDPSSFLYQGISQALGSTQKYQIEWAQEIVITIIRLHVMFGRALQGQQASRKMPSRAQQDLVRQQSVGMGVCAD